MGSLRQIGAGFLLGVISIAAVIGSFALSRAEGSAEIAIPSLSASPQVAVITVYPTIPMLTNTPQPVDTALVTDTPEPIATIVPTLTPPPPPPSCLPPNGWLPIQIQAYETLVSLAQRYQTTPDAIKQGNCLFSDQLVDGSFLYVPPRPIATLVPCGAPRDWVNYRVVAGDTLFNIGVRYHVDVMVLQRANCLGASTFIQAGSLIKVPNVPTSVPPTLPPTWTLPPTLEVPPPTATDISPLPTATLVPTTEVPPTTPPPTETTQPPPTLTIEPTASPTNPAQG
jgi:LysM repeat protein